MVGTDSSHSMLPCNHEEADTRILIHLLDALEHGSSTCLVGTVDTDVVVILIGKFHALLTQYSAASIWIAFGSGKNYTHLHINTISHALGKDKSTALPVFHCYTGCDTTSAFCGKGKKSAWIAWNSYPEVTQAFNYIAANPHTPVTTDAQHFQCLERYTVVLYDKTSDLESVNEESCSARRPKQWNIFHQPKEH